MAVEYGSEVLRRFGSSGTSDRRFQSQHGIVSGEAQDRTLNVWIRMELGIVDGVIASASYRVFGCPHAVAAADWITEWAEGRHIEHIRQLDIHEVAAELEVPVHKLGKLLRIEDALLQCVERYGARKSEGNR